MYKVIIWGMGKWYNQYFNLIKFQESKEKIIICGIVSNDNGLKKIDSYPFIEKKYLKYLEFDYCIVAMNNYEEAVKESIFLGINRECLIPIRVFSIPYFDFEEYIEIKNSKISIISRNCWGGICYHYFGLKFNSPFINLFFLDTEFNKLLSDFDNYMSLPLIYEKDVYGEREGKSYPVGRLGDIRIYFNHYASFDEAKRCWERRKDRINYNNLLVVSTTSCRDVAEEFDKLPYNNKIIFVPFNTALESSVSIFDKNDNDFFTFGMKANSTGNGEKGVIDLIQLLSKGRIRERIEI